MLKRAFDIFVALAAVSVLSPLLLIGAIGIAVSSPGPLLYRAVRGGRHGVPFVMYKFRTMHVSDGQGSAITAPGDRRVFLFGNFLRKTKIDELPQFFNILKGDISIVGPRPEDARLIDDHYTGWMRETLRIRPGVTSPGAIFGYTRGDEFLDPADPEGSYIVRQMPIKLAIERAYLDQATFMSDLVVCFKTVVTIFATFFGFEVEVDPELRRAAAQWKPDSAYLAEA